MRRTLGPSCRRAEPKRPEASEAELPIEDHGVIGDLRTVAPFANHVGLYAKELSFSGRHLDNYPQVLTGLALISAVSCLDRSLGDAPKGQWA